MKSSKELPRKERERLRHRQEILSAAMRLFAEKGFHNVSMQEIAAKAEFATGTLYKFFTSKEALFDELTHNCGQRIISDLTAILDGPGDEVDCLRTFIRRQPALLEEHAEFIKVYVSEFGIRGAKVSKRSDESELHTILTSRLEALLEAGIGKGLFRRVDPTVAAKAVGSILETVAFEMAGHFDMATATDTFAKIEQLFLGGLLLPETHNDG